MPKRGIWRMSDCGNRDRFEIGSSIRPRNDHLLLAQVAALLFHDGHQVGQTLEGMINVALHVEDRRAAGFGNSIQVFVAIAKVAVTNGNAIEIATKDLADLHGGIAV